LSEMDLVCFFGVTVDELLRMIDRDCFFGVTVEPLRSTGMDKSKCLSRNLRGEVATL
jgi:hypothetical protein